MKRDPMRFLIPLYLLCLIGFAMTVVQGKKVLKEQETTIQSLKETIKYKDTQIEALNDIARAGYWELIDEDSIVEYPKPLGQYPYGDGDTVWRGPHYAVPIIEDSITHRKTLKFNTPHKVIMDTIYTPKFYFPLEHNDTLSYWSIPGFNIGTEMAYPGDTLGIQLKIDSIQAIIRKIKVTMDSVEKERNRITNSI